MWVRAYSWAHTPHIRVPSIRSEQEEELSCKRCVDTAAEWVNSGITWTFNQSSCHLPHHHHHTCPTAASGAHTSTADHMVGLCSQREEEGSQRSPQASCPGVISGGQETTRKPSPPPAVDSMCVCVCCKSHKTLAQLRFTAHLQPATARRSFSIIICWKWLEECALLHSLLISAQHTLSTSCQLLVIPCKQGFELISIPTKLKPALSNLVIKFCAVFGRP